LGTTRRASDVSRFGQKVTIEADDSTDFSRYKTFKMNEGQLDAKSPSLNNDLVRKLSRFSRFRAPCSFNHSIFSSCLRNSFCMSGCDESLESP
jgi:hypothetical protein